MFYQPRHKQKRRFYYEGFDSLGQVVACFAVSCVAMTIFLLMVFSV